MTPDQIGAVILSLLAVGAGAVGTAAVTTGPPDVAPPPWANDDQERNINVSVDGNVTPGETVTLTASLHGEPVPHSPVEVNGETVGETDADGRIDVTVPDADEFEVEIEPEFEGETAVSLENEADDDDAAEPDEEEADENDEERRIDLAIEGNVTPNETVTVLATVNSTPLANADVSVNGEHVGTTDANGTVEVTVSAEADEFQVGAEFDQKAKYKVALEVEDETEADEDDEREFDIAIDGEVAPNETVTVTVTDGSEPVENASVSVNGAVVGTTATDGQLDVTVPADADEVEIEVETEDGEGEYEHEFENDEDDEEDDHEADEDND